MSDLMQTLLTAFGTSVGAIASLGFLAWLLVTHRLAKDLEDHKQALGRDLEQHKAELKKAADLELANAKADLDKRGEELKSRLRQDETRLQALEGKADLVFGRLHQRRLELVEDLFRKLVLAHSSATHCVSPFQGPEPSKERYENLASAEQEAREALYVGRLFLPDDLFQQGDDFLSVLREAARKFAIGLQHEKRGNLSKTAEEGPWVKPARMIREDAGQIFKVVMDGFRDLVANPNRVESIGSEASEGAGEASRQ